MGPAGTFANSNLPSGSVCVVKSKPKVICPSFRSPSTTTLPASFPGVPRTRPWIRPQGTNGRTGSDFSRAHKVSAKPKVPRDPAATMRSTIGSFWSFTRPSSSVWTMTLRPGVPNCVSPSGPKTTRVPGVTNPIEACGAGRPPASTTVTSTVSDRSSETSRVTSPSSYRMGRLMYGW